MNNSQLLKKFNQAIGWNAFLYVIHKGLFFATSLLLYKKLSVESFCTWANLNCSIFLFLLWIDFGFRKSVPRYAPEFGSSQKTRKKFVNSLIVFQFTALIVAAPLFFFLARFFFQKLQLPSNQSLLYGGCILFFVEGMISLVRVVYHSYFLNKQFNLFASVVLFLQTLSMVVLLCIQQKTANIILQLLALKIVAGVVLLVGALSFFFVLQKKFSLVENKKICTQTKWLEFAKHSGVMWATSGIKSTTERNFLVPLFTFLLGPQQGNLFKIANDAGLFFQRIAIKTIGTTDTSLLAYAQTGKRGKNFEQTAFKKLTAKLKIICFPLLGISLILFLGGYRIIGNRIASPLAFLLTVCYLLHVLLSPYERILEVKRKYLKLFFVYLPYLLFFFLIASGTVSSIGLLGSVLIIHAVRLVSASIALLLAQKLLKPKP